LTLEGEAGCRVAHLLQLPVSEAAIRLPWSNGQAEGQINRLKLVKRQMYGRANFDLLKLRFLLGQTAVAKTDAGGTRCEFTRSNEKSHRVSTAAFRITGRQRLFATVRSSCVIETRCEIRPKVARAITRSHFFSTTKMTPTAGLWKARHMARLLAVATSAGTTDNLLLHQMGAKSAKPRNALCFACHHFAT